MRKKRQHTNKTITRNIYKDKKTYTNEEIRNTNYWKMRNIQKYYDKLFPPL